MIAITSANIVFRDETAHGYDQRYCEKALHALHGITLEMTLHGKPSYAMGVLADLLRYISSNHRVVRELSKNEEHHIIKPFANDIVRNRSCIFCKNQTKLKFAYF
jgi:hypothetical protein